MFNKELGLMLYVDDVAAEKVFGQRQVLSLKMKRR